MLVGVSAFNRAPLNATVATPQGGWHLADGDIAGALAVKKKWAMDYFLGKIFFDNCVNVNGAPRMRTPSRRSGARSCHAPGGMAA